MIIVMKHHATTQEIAAVVQHIESLGFKAHLSQGEERAIIGVIGDERPVEPELFELLDGVERVMRILHPFAMPTERPARCSHGPIATPTDWPRRPPGRQARRYGPEVRHHPE